MSVNNTVLLITERPEQFSLAALLFKEAGYRVFFANSTSDGVRTAELEMPRLIVSELAAAHIDGLEICRRVRMDKKMWTTPILLIGDLSEESAIVDDGRRCGANEYVQKPVEQGTLFDRCFSLMISKTSRYTNLRREPLVYSRPLQHV